MLITVLFIVLVCFGIGEAFFLFEKHQPILLCVKICPLYCSPRRRDEDASSLIYTDIKPNYYYDHAPHPYHRYCQPKPKPTTPKPTKTTETQPEYIYPDYESYGPHPYFHCCNPKPTPTTTKPKTTTNTPYFYADDYDEYPEPIPHYWRPQPKPTTEKTTTTQMTTTEEPTWICMVCQKKCGFPPS